MLANDGCNDGEMKRESMGDDDGDDGDGDDDDDDDDDE